MEMLSTTIPDGDEGPVEPLESTAGEIPGLKFRRHRILWLTITENDNENFFHWLVGDHVPPKSSELALIASPEKCERLLRSKDFEAWRTNPDSVLWLYDTGKLMAIWWFWLGHSSDATFS